MSERQRGVPAPDAVHSTDGPHEKPSTPRFLRFPIETKSGS